MRLASASAADAADGGGITVFASLGLAVEDLAAVTLAHRAAGERGAGASAES